MPTGEGLGGACKNDLITVFCYVLSVLQCSIMPDMNGEAVQRLRVA
jgi:hypothetical protein